MSSRLIAFALVGSFLLPAPLSAQSLAEQDGRVNRQVGISLTIPFGGSQNEQAEPHIDLRLRQDRAVPDYQWSPNRRAEPLFETRIGFTLNSEPRLMINGKKLEKQDRRQGISTLGYVGIGVGVILAAGIIAYLASCENEDNEDKSISLEPPCP